MAGAFSRGGTFSPTVAEDHIMRCRCNVEKRRGYICIELFLDSRIELYEMVTERNYAIVLARHRLDLLASAVIWS